MVAFDQVVLDITNEAAVQAAFEAIGPFDHLVVTAGPELGSWGSFMVLWAPRRSVGRKP